MKNKYLTDLAKFLIQSNSLKFGKFRLSSGEDSSFYVDLRLMQSFPMMFHQTIIALRDKIRTEKILFDSLATIPTSGLIFTSAVAYEMFKPLIYVRKEAKGHGINNLIEGKVQECQKILLIDDVVTSGRSMSNAVENIRKSGAIVENMLCILLRGGDITIKKLAENEITLHFLLTTIEMADILYENNLINAEERNKLQK